MERMFTFHKSVMGYSHLSAPVPRCEDASTSFSDDAGRYHIAIIADGHGQEESFRSHRGSRAAADSAMECLKIFAEAVLASPEREQAFLGSIFTDSRYRRETIRRLTDAIYAGWHDRIDADFTQDPPTAEEQTKYAAYCSDPYHRPHIYGTTLIAALHLGSCLLLLHQGDGRCDVFYADGSVDQPIPWDDRCIGNLTTSLCDFDAPESIRHCVLDTRKKAVVACYVGSDGVEDAYRSQEGTHTFYRHLSNWLLERLDTDFDEELGKKLTHFSAHGLFSPKGSLDDVSVAGILMPEALRALSRRFDDLITRFDLSEQLFHAEHQIGTRERSRAILRRRMQEASDKLAPKVRTLETMKAEKESLFAKIASLDQEITRLRSELDEDSAAFDEFHSRLEQRVQPEEPEQGHYFRIFRSLERKDNGAFQSIMGQLKGLINTQDSRLKKLLEMKKQLYRRVQELDANMAAAQQELDTLRQQAQKATDDFNAYEETYQGFVRKAETLRDQISLLS